MHTINTVRRLGRAIVLVSVLFILSLAAGCGNKDELGLARQDTGRSQLYYQHAVERYKNLIAKGKDVDLQRFELGRLYYEHGDFARARGELVNSKFAGSSRFLAMIEYQLGDYSTALEAFNRNDFSDDQARYYHGLTAEKLNLFDQALEQYRKISGPAFGPQAKERMDNIEKKASVLHLNDLEPRLNKILAQAPAQEEYPQAGALILACDEDIEITPDNRQVSTMHYLLKILNDRGKADFSETGIDYDSTYEKVELEYARTIRPDGSVAEVGTRHIRDVSRYMNFPLYSNARVFIISFPEIAAGVAIEYKFKIYRSQLINKKDFILAYPLQTAEPVLSANFSLSLPPGYSLRLKTINSQYNDFGAVTDPVRQDKDGRQLYQWQFKNIPQVIPEPQMPPSVRINPAILLSTFKEWAQVYQWWHDLSKDRIKADQAIKDKVRELTKDKTSPQDQARAIYNFCAREIRYVAVEYGQAGYQPHQAEDIFRNKYGDCKDQAVLLVTMLKDAGLPAFLVLIPTDDCYELMPDFPSVLFDHCIAMVRLDGQDIFLDPTAQTCSFGDLPPADQGRRVLVFAEDGFKIQQTPEFSAGHNSVKQELNIRIDKDEKLSAEKSVFTGGLYEQAQRYWLLYTQPELIKEALKEKIQEISIGAQLDSYDIKNADDLDKPVELRYDFSGPEYWTAAGALRIMPQLAGLDTSLVAKDKRRYPIDFNTLDKRETLFTIAIPDSFVIKYMPGNVSYDNRWLRLAIQYSRDKNKIVFRQETELKSREVSRQDYAEFKDFYESLAKKIKQNIILEKIK